MLNNRQSLTLYPRFPIEHHKRIRHSNFIERTFGETRRRVKVTGRFPGETSCVNHPPHSAAAARTVPNWLSGFCLLGPGPRQTQARACRPGRGGSHL
jgi:transposase-like protein